MLITINSIDPHGVGRKFTGEKGFIYWLDQNNWPWQGLHRDRGMIFQVNKSLFMGKTCINNGGGGVLEKRAESQGVWVIEILH